MIKDQVSRIHIIIHITPFQVLLGRKGSVSMELVQDYCSERDLSWSRWPSWSIGSRGKKCLPKEFKMSGTFVIRKFPTRNEVGKLFCFDFGLENMGVKSRFSQSSFR